MSARLHAAAVAVALAVRLQAAPPSVGLEQSVSVDLAEAGLEARPVDERAPTVVRVVSAVPLPDGQTRYTLACMGLEPGVHDLAAYLLRADGTPATNLPPITVAVRSVLPPDANGAVSPPPPRGLPAIGGYRAAWAAGLAVWAAGWIALARHGRRRHTPAAPATPPPPPPSVTERIRALLAVPPETLDTAHRAELERLVLDAWRSHTDHVDTPLDDLLPILRSQPESAAALASLDNWLHRPAPSPPPDPANLVPRERGGSEQ